MPRRAGLHTEPNLNFFLIWLGEHFKFGGFGRKQAAAAVRDFFGGLAQAAIVRADFVHPVVAGPGSPRILVVIL